MTNPITRGIHHVGLTVSKLEESAAFFTTILGWKEVRRNDEYPAVFVSDGGIMLSLWKNKQEPAAPFDKEKNPGLHHIAFVVESEVVLTEVHGRLKKHNVKIEFSPEPLRAGPARHMMCYEPSGIRVEFLWPGV